MIACNSYGIGVKTVFHICCTGLVREGAELGLSLKKSNTRPIESDLIDLRGKLSLSIIVS